VTFNQLVAEDFILLLYLFLLFIPSLPFFFAKGPFTQKAALVFAKGLEEICHWQTDCSFNI